QLVQQIDEGVGNILGKRSDFLQPTNDPLDDILADKLEGIHEQLGCILGKIADTPGEALQPIPDILDALANVAANPSIATPERGDNIPGDIEDPSRQPPEESPRRFNALADVATDAPV